MVNYSAAALDATFGALADPTRRAILARLAEKPDASVGELARPFAMSPPAISKHLRVLEGAGLLARRREGRVHHCRFVPGPMRTAADWIAHYRRSGRGGSTPCNGTLEESVEKDEKEKPWSSPRLKPQRRRRSGSRARSRPRATGSSGRGRTRSS